MKFAPQPASSFSEFIETYFRRCRERAPEIEANAGKWTFEDLIRGLSDFDTRFITRDGMTADDWCRMSMQVGQTHLDLARERPYWARTLEHLPGVNLQWSEVLDPGQHFTEFAKWSFHHGPPLRLAECLLSIASRPWTDADREYHWKTLAVYYGPYDRAIDPPINLGPYENKYPLHSRIMHYFAPPVHSAVCLTARRTTPGKLDAFRRARELFPNPEVIAEALAIVNAHYEAPELLSEPGVTELDRRLEKYLQDMVSTLLESEPDLACPRRPSPAQLKEATRGLRGSSPMARFFENIKFARLMKGRLWFYGQEVPWFDSLWLIRNELGRIRSNFYEAPLRLFGKHILDLDTTPEAVLATLAGGALDREQAEACRVFAELTQGEIPDRSLKAKALAIADRFDPFLHAIEALRERALRKSE